MKKSIIFVTNYTGFSPMKDYGILSVAAGSNFIPSPVNFNNLTGVEMILDLATGGY